MYTPVETFIFPSGAGREEEPSLGAELVEAGSGLYTQGFHFPTPMQEELEFPEKVVTDLFPSTPTDDSMDR